VLQSLAVKQRDGRALAAAAAAKVRAAGGVPHDITFVQAEVQRAAQGVVGSEAQRGAVMVELGKKSAWPAAVADLWAEFQLVVPGVAAKVLQGEAPRTRPRLIPLKAALNAWIDGGMVGEVEWQQSAAAARLVARSAAAAGDPAAALRALDPRLV
jgi:hypothetical protein